MIQRRHDGLTLAIGCFLVSLGCAMLVDAMNLHNLGGVFYVLPGTVAWPLRVFWFQEQAVPLLAIILVGVGAGQLWQCMDPHLRLRFRIASNWAAWVCLANLLGHRLLFFPLEARPPWWAILAVGSLLLASTIRRISEVRGK